MVKYILFLLISLNAFSSIEINNLIISSDLNEKLNELYKMKYKTGVSAVSINSTTKVDVPSRALTFTKKYNSTKLVLFYGDVFRVDPSNKMCTLYLEIDGVS